MAPEQVVLCVKDLLEAPERNIQCKFPGCLKTFKHRPALNMHMSMTHGEKNLISYGKGTKNNGRSQIFLCPVEACSRSKPENAFKTKKLLKQHYLRVHADRKFICPTCSRKYITQSELNGHMINCGRRFVCSICHTPYTTLNGLKTHQRSLHNSAFRLAQQLVQNTPASDVPLIQPCRRSLPASRLPAATLPPLLPKPAVLSSSSSSVSMTTQTASDFLSQTPASRESCGTQTDLLQKAVFASALPLNPVTLAPPTAGVMRVPPTASMMRASETCVQTMNSTSIAQPHIDLPPFESEMSFNHLVGEWVPNPHYSTSFSSTHQDVSNFGTQTTEPAVPNSDFATQTPLSNLLEEIREECGGDMTSFGTQTQTDCLQDVLQLQSTSQCGVTSLGTQTMSRDGGVSSYPAGVQGSSSDFSMQVPYELIDFSTQTLISHSDGLDISLPGSLDCIGIGASHSQSSTQTDLDISLPSSLDCIGIGASHSQSSTQTDLESLLNSMETQTDFAFS